jgi:hypothetical protein
MPYNRPDRHRLSRIRSRVERALDEIERANGETRPSQFKQVRDALKDATTGLESILIHIDEALAQAATATDTDDEIEKDQAA